MCVPVGGGWHCQLAFVGTAKVAFVRGHGQLAFVGMANWRSRARPSGALRHRRVACASTAKWRSRLRPTGVRGHGQVALSSTAEWRSHAPPAAPTRTSLVAAPGICAKACSRAGQATGGERRAGRPVRSPRCGGPRREPWACGLPPGRYGEYRHGSSPPEPPDPPRPRSRRTSRAACVYATHTSPVNRRSKVKSTQPLTD